MTQKYSIVSLLAAILATSGAANTRAHANTANAPPTDALLLGVASSEEAHKVQPEQSETVLGGLQQPARILKAPQTPDWRGGSLAFEMKVDPQAQNYFTVRLWGSDVSANYLILYCDGKQIGYRHLGDIDVLDFGSKEPAYPGRFFYRTTPLPIALTRGKTQLGFKIQSTGTIWGYGRDFEEYQKAMTEPTRGIYSVYTHTEGFFTPPADEVQGKPPLEPPVRSGPGPEVLERVKERVNKEINGILSDRRPPGQLQMQLLGRAYHVKWTVAHQSDLALKKIIEGGDALYAAFAVDPKVAQNGPGVYNPDWLGLGPAADGVRWIAQPLQAHLDERITGGKSRREAWAEMFAASRDWHRRNRRLYTNQSMINDLYGIYLSNRGVAAVDAAKAMPEADARRYLYESLGIEPWRDSDPGAEVIRETNRRRWGIGPDYYQLTAKGLTKELGYVGNYGEVLDWIAHIYNATRPEFGQPGDERIKAQLIKAEHARAPFRYPMLDSGGNRAMRMENVVGWRDMLYPGEVTYAERSAWEGSAIYSTAATLDPRSVGAVQQMFEDNQFFASVEGLLKDQGTRVTNTLLWIPDDYALLSSQPKVAHRLPMTSGQPDFVFSDEEDGVIAIKRGEDILYASLYWRARYGINGLARVHYITPAFDRIAVVHQETQFTPGGLIYTRPNHTNFGFGNGGLRYPDAAASAHAGEQLPIAKIPEGVTFRPGDESVYAGKGDFYTLRYGPYLIAMNCTADRSYTLAVPPVSGPVPELVSGKTVAVGEILTVGPRSTVVLHLQPN